LLLLPIQTQIELFVIINHGNSESIQEAKTAQDIQRKRIAFGKINDGLPLKVKDRDRHFLPVEAMGSSSIRVTSGRSTPWERARSFGPDLSAASTQH